MRIRPIRHVGTYTVTHHTGKTVDVEVFLSAPVSLNVEVARNPADTENIVDYRWVYHRDLRSYRMNEIMRSFLERLPWDGLLPAARWTG